MFDPPLPRRGRAATPDQPAAIEPPHIDAAALQAWSWLKELYPSELAEFEGYGAPYCLRLCEPVSDTELDIRLDLAHAQLHFCSTMASLPQGSEHKALDFLEGNRHLNWPQAQLHFAYWPERREIFVRGAAALAQFDGCSSLQAFLQELLARVAQLKAQSRLWAGDAPCA